MQRGRARKKRGESGRKRGLVWGGGVRVLGRALVVEVINSKTPTSFYDLLYLKLCRRGGSFSLTENSTERPFHHSYVYDH